MAAHPPVQGDILRQSLHILSKYVYTVQYSAPSMHSYIISVKYSTLLNISHNAR